MSVFETFVSSVHNSLMQNPSKSSFTFVDGKNPEISLPKKLNELTTWKKSKKDRCAY
jgi:hypothetical protein